MDLYVILNFVLFKFNPLDESRVAPVTFLVTAFSTDYFHVWVYVYVSQAVWESIVKSIRIKFSWIVIRQSRSEALSPMIGNPPS